jgi:cytochrome P450
MMLMDPAVWGDPENFRPERYLEPEASQIPNPLAIQFGWGIRYISSLTHTYLMSHDAYILTLYGFRVCPGMYLADRVVIHMVSTVISIYKVEALEGHTIPDPQKARYSPGTFQYEYTLFYT